MSLRPGDHAPEWDCGLGDLEPSSPADKLDSIIWLLEDVRNLLVNTASAAPGVTVPDDAADGPGGHPPTRPPGPTSSGMSDDLIPNLREMEAAAARDIERSITVEGREFNTGYRAALRWVLSLTKGLPEQQSDATLANDPASVHARTMRQRHNEDREQ